MQLELFMPIREEYAFAGAGSSFLRMPTFYEFFTGGGMARVGLGSGWECLFANEIDAKKAYIYCSNFGPAGLSVGDVADLTPEKIPGCADLVWGSFPCQDLSLAGSGAGLNGKRSGTFWPFWNLIHHLDLDGRGAPVVVLENVCGALSSHDGKDFAAIAEAVTSHGYRFGAVVIDAKRFLPQSRPRLFVICARQNVVIPGALAAVKPVRVWHPSNLTSAYEKLSQRSKEAWVWWRMPEPRAKIARFAELIEEHPSGIAWHTPAETRRLLHLMSPLNLKKVGIAKQSGKLIIGTVYKRTRPDVDGVRRQRAEVRFDDIAGCLRTPRRGFEPPDHSERTWK